MSIMLPVFLLLFYVSFTSCILIPFLFPSLHICPPPLNLPPDPRPAPAVKKEFKRKKRKNSKRARIKKFLAMETSI